MCEKTKFSQLSQDFPDLKTENLLSGGYLSPGKLRQVVTLETKMEQRRRRHSTTQMGSSRSLERPQHVASQEGRKQESNHSHRLRQMQPHSKLRLNFKLFLAFWHLEQFIRLQIQKDTTGNDNKPKQLDNTITTYMQDTVSCYFSYWIDATWDCGNQIFFSKGR